MLSSVHLTERDGGMEGGTCTEQHLYKQNSVVNQQTHKNKSTFTRLHGKAEAQQI